ncbi:MAG: methyl-accepting chemotaxis protein [Candidatus Omnitrophica bacterium]|nr:methyl-accepting chemotaxis protein [Candidatus Omnitrophota bacterium]
MGYKRKQYFINKTFQSEFIVKFCGLVIMGSVVFGIILYLFSKHALTTSFENSRLVIKSTADYIFPGLLFGGVITAIITALAAGAVVILMTHRIAGPMYRFERYINEIGSGRLYSDLKIRKKDQFQNMAGSLNKMTHDLKLGLLEVNDVSDELDKLIEELSASSSREILLREDIKRIVGELKKDKQNLSRALEHFKIKI